MVLVTPLLAQALGELLPVRTGLVFDPWALLRAAFFGMLVAAVGCQQGFFTTGGAEGVGRVTTRAVVHGITAIVLTDMLFVFATTR